MRAVQAERAGGSAAACGSWDRPYALPHSGRHHLLLRRTGHVGAFPGLLTSCSRASCGGRPLSSRAALDYAPESA